MSDDSGDDIEPRLLIDIAALRRKFHESDDSSQDEDSDKDSETENPDDTENNSLSPEKEIEKLILLNEQQDLCLMQLQAKIEEKLAESYKQLEIVRNKIRVISTSKNRRYVFRPKMFGAPYFRDKDNNSPPLNIDAICRRQCQLINNFVVSSGNGWSHADKKRLQYEMLNLSRSRKIRRLEDKLATLSCNNMTKKMRKLAEEKIKNTIKVIESASLATVAPPVDFEFNWEVLADKLRNRHTPHEIRSMWKQYLHPSLLQTDFSRIECLYLEDIARHYDYQNWDNIALELGGRRSGFQCYVYFRTIINRTCKGVKWTVEEDEFLRRTVEMYRIGNYIPWSTIAACFQDKSKEQIYNRYINSAHPDLKKGKFLPEEDAVILAAVNQFGHNFRKVAKYLPGRTAPQIRTRYNLSLVRKMSAVWTAEEDRKLLHLMKSSDTDRLNFSETANHFPNKDRSSIRMRYVTLQKWIRSNPNTDLGFAPRRGPRIISRVKPVDLRTAVDALVYRIDLDASNPTPKVIPPDIYNEFTDLYMKALIVEESYSSNVQEKKETKHDDDTDNLRILLLMLKTNLKKQKFSSTSFASKYHKLLGPDPHDGITHQVRTYSRKSAVTNVSCRPSVSIWDDEAGFVAKYLLPVNYQIITGCKNVMQAAHRNGNGNKRMLSLGRASALTEHYEIFLTRCEIIFTWCLYLSCVPCRGNLSNPFNVHDEMQAKSTLQVQPAQAKDATSTAKKTNLPDNTSFCMKTNPRLKHRDTIIKNPTKIDLPELPQQLLKSKTSMVVNELLGKITSIEAPGRRRLALYPADDSKVDKKKQQFRHRNTRRRVCKIKDADRDEIGRSLPSLQQEYMDEKSSSDEEDDKPLKRKRESASSGTEDQSTTSSPRKQKARRGKTWKK